ncbi:NUDIX hydrolase [Caproicibacter sp.]|uniref:NUDIX hydrolase n=1 Tax=Caproicibacter sp. TaxID=2814884 RepID=UPI003989B244
MEFLDIVDEDGNPTGETVSREAAHRLGVRHRTSHVWILRMREGKRQVLLQKRSFHKDSYPGCYDISSAGHVPAGDGFLQSALRELKEELGVNAVEKELIYCGCRRFEYRGQFHGHEFRDNQVSNVYALWKNPGDGEFVLQKSEVDSVVWMNWDACVDLVKNSKAPHCIRLEELEMIQRACCTEPGKER